MTQKMRCLETQLDTYRNQVLEEVKQKTSIQGLHQELTITKAVLQSDSNRCHEEKKEQEVQCKSLKGDLRKLRDTESRCEWKLFIKEQKLSDYEKV